METVVKETVDVVTGAGTGIGRAIAQRLAAAGRGVIGVGRRHAPLEEASAGHSSLEVLPADVAEPDGRAAIVAAVRDRRVGFLIHNAGVLEPVGPLLSLELEAWRQQQAINVEAPLFLTQALLPRLARGARVLHISSGAADRPVAGWGGYCVSKAALLMIYRLLRDELAQRDVSIASMRPGVVDTSMQTLIRAQDERQFPDVERFRALKREGKLATPQTVAEFAFALLTKTDANRFSAEEWDLNQHAEQLF